MELKKVDKVRYSLHSEVRKEGFKLDTRKRTVYVPCGGQDLPENVIRLRDEFGYALQTEIPVRI